MISMNEELKVGNYYRRRATPKPKADDKFQADDLVLLIDVDLDDQDVSYTAYAKNQWFTLPINDFLQCFKYEGEGRAIRDREFQKLINEASTVAAEITEEAEQLRGIEHAFQPAALPGLTDSPAEIAQVEEIAAEESVSLVRVNEPSEKLVSANQWIEAIAERRNRIGDKKDQLKTIQDRIEGLQAEQQAWLECMTAFTDISKRLNEVIGTLNLYLGNNEEIIQLSAGKPAEGPLAIRQLVLYMDEECALYAEEGGIDARSIPDFDEWLLADQRNLDQVLPEQKGIVCIKPRRSDIDYGDAFINMKMNEANKITYILIRNGENLFRLVTDWQTGKYFFPCQAEFDQIEYKHREYDRNRMRYNDPQKITPKDGRVYKEMLAKREQLEKHYSRALILLQGLVDRTGIFPDLQDRGLNLMDISANNQYLRFIYDADPSKLLVTGRETFDEWQTRTNKLLVAGDRIIGVFGWNQIREDDLKERMRSAWSGRPDGMTLYTLEKGSDGELRILFDADSSDYWNGYEYVKRKNRVGFRIFTSDSFIIAYDQITLEDAKYFLNDRLSRHAYADMFPLLRRVRNMKQIERNEEQPFLDLLVNDASKKIALDRSILEQQINEVVTWYKFKNKTHRSLSQDDAKAYRMIMREWAKRRLTESAAADSPVIEDIQNADTLLIAMRDQDLIHIERADQNQIFVHRSIMRRSKREQAYRLVEKREWVIIGQEYLTWQVLYEAPEWAEWPKGSRNSADYLTTPELEAFLPLCYQKAQGIIRGHAEWFLDVNRSDRESIKSLKSELFRIDLKKGYIELFYYVTGKANGKLLYGEISIPINWKRKAGQVVIASSDYHNWSKGAKSGDDLEAGSSWNPEKESHFIYFIDRDVLQKMNALHAAYKEERAKSSQQQWTAIKVFEAATKDINAKIEETAKQAYIDNHGDARLWKAYKDRAKLKSFHQHDLFGEAIEALQEWLKRHDVMEAQLIGKTIAEIIEMADINLQNPPPQLDLSIIPFKAKVEETAEEEESEDEDYILE